MKDIDYVINKLEKEYIKQYRYAIEYNAMFDYQSYLEDAAEYLKMLKSIMEIAAKDNGKSATKSFEYMDQIKEVLKPKIDKTGFNTEKQYMDIIETVKKKGYWDK
jgi:hypothetical protein